MYSLRNLRLLVTPQRLQNSQRNAHQVRVRFAPSPTGHLHLGGLRTALYNYLYAKNMNGKFILRIEDTDQTRLVPGATESLIKDLLWSGIQIDEGPGSFGGQLGPYVQSERIHIYSEAVRQLLSNGTAYRCFCTEHRLDLLRKDALRMRQVPRYDNHCRHLTKKEENDLMERKVAFCIRFKLSDHAEPLNDLIYGQVQHNVSDTEGDPVIMKSDNFPTYHFANVVDDHLMHVTHVFRGVEWQISTTKHLLLYKAFGWQPPEYGHLPLLVNSDGTKLSKRQGDIGIKHLREKGYFPEALVNYVITAGGGFAKDPGEKLTIHSNNDLAKQFDIEKLNSRPSRLNPLILDDLNRLKIVQLCNDEESADHLIRSVKTLIKEAYPTHTNLDLNEKLILSILKWSANRLTFLKDLTSVNMSFLWVKPDLNSVILNDITKAQIQQLLVCLDLVPFSKDNISTALKEFAKKEQIKFATLMKTLRSALSGLKDGPSVAEMMEILGKNAVLERLNAIFETQNFGNSNNKISEAA